MAAFCISALHRAARCVYRHDTTPNSLALRKQFKWWSQQTQFKSQPHYLLAVGSGTYHLLSQRLTADLYDGASFLYLTVIRIKQIITWKVPGTWCFSALESELSSKAIFSSL